MSATSDVQKCTADKERTREIACKLENNTLIQEWGGGGVGIVLFSCFVMLISLLIALALRRARKIDGWFLTSRALLPSFLFASSDTSQGSAASVKR